MRLPMARDAQAPVPGALHGLRALFVNMPLRESARPNTPPQGPALLAARLREYGAEVALVDLNAYRIQDASAEARGLPNGRHLTEAEAIALIERTIQKVGTPDLVGLSGMITTLRWQEYIAKALRERLPDAFLVSGGGLATELREGLFAWMPELDAIGHSEGDEIILQMAQDALWLKRRGGRAHREALRHEGRGQVILSATGTRYVYHGDRVNLLDNLPFSAWDLLHQDVDGVRILERYIGVPVWGLGANNSSATSFSMQRSLTTVSSRGCPYACAFCYRGAQGERQYRMRSAQNLAKEVRWLVDTYQVDFVGFPDDNFAVDRKRIDELPNAFHGMNIRWGTHTRLDEADERLIPMARSGCVYIGFGAESASAPVLRRMGKGGFILKRGATKPEGADRVFPQTMVDGIEWCRRTGIHANCTWIMGYPGETLEDLQTSIAFILWQRRLMTQGLTPGSSEYAQALASVNERMFTATAYPGTEMFRDEKVRRLLGEAFGLHFLENGEPIVDDALRQYVLELDDATKLLRNPETGQALNFGEMPDDLFLRARALIDEGKLEAVMDLTP